MTEKRRGRKHNAADKIAILRRKTVEVLYNCRRLNSHLDHSTPTRKENIKSTREARPMTCLQSRIDSGTGGQAAEKLRREPRMHARRQKNKHAEPSVARGTHFRANEQPVLYRKRRVP